MSLRELPATRHERSILQRRGRDVPEYLHDKLYGLPDLFTVMRQAVRDIYANRHDDDNKNILDGLIEKYGERDGMLAARAAMHLARSSMKYWGVNDPSSEAWCNRCKEVKPLDEFDEGSIATCGDCFRHRLELDAARGEREIAPRYSYAERSA